MIHSPLDPTERSEVNSGSVFIWEESSDSLVTGYGAAPGRTSYLRFAPLLYTNKCANSLRFSLLDIGSPGYVRGIGQWTDGLKWGPGHVHDVSHPS